MKKMERLLFVLLVCIMISQPTWAQGEKTKIKLDNATQTVREVPILLDGQLLYSTPISFIHPKDSYTLVPVRFITESLGARVGWDQKSKMVTVVQGSKYVTMNIDSRDVYINGKKKTLDNGVSPKLIENNTMVPLRFLTETFGYNISFDENLKIPVIDTKNTTVKDDDNKVEKEKEENNNEYFKVIKIGQEMHNNKNSIAIYTTGNARIKQTRLVNPKRVVVDFMDTTISKTYGEYKFNIDEVDRLRVSQFDGSEIYGRNKMVVRAVVDLNEYYIDSDIDVVEENNKIILVPKTKKKLDKNEENVKDELEKEKDKEIDKDDVKEDNKEDKRENPKENIIYKRNGNKASIDFYLDKDTSYNLSYNKYENSIEVLVPEDSFTLYENIKITDDLVSSLKVDRVGKYYRFNINLKKEVEIKDSLVKNKLNLSLTEKKPVVNKPTKPTNNGSKTIVIDPGHGGKKPGTIQNGIVEKELALEISQKLNKALINNGYNTLMTREDDSHIDLKPRADIANGANADLLISIHANSAVPSASGVEVLYNPYDKIYSTGEQAKELSRILSEEISNATNSRNRGPKDRPNLVVLRETNNASVLIEVGFLSNDSEAKLLETDDYQNKIVQAIVKGLDRYFDIY